MRGLEALLPLPLPPQVGPWSVPQSSKHRLLPLLLLLLLHLSTTAAQFCTGTETFEKVEMRMMEVMLMVVVSMMAVMVMVVLVVMVMVMMMEVFTITTSGDRG